MANLANFLIDRLYRNGVKHMFALAGSYNIHFLEKVTKSQIKVIPTTNELSSGFAADAYARVEGIGCCCATYCVGGFSLMNAIAGGYAEKSPIIFIGGSPGIQERQSKYMLHHQVGNFECQHDIFSEITCANTVLRDSDRAGYEIDRVLQAAQHYKQPVYIELPRDMIDKPIRYDAYTIGTPKEKQSDEAALKESIEEITRLLNESKNPLIWAGVELSRFNLGKSIIKFSEQTNIPIITTILGKSVVSEKHPMVLGVYCNSTSDQELVDFVNESDCVIAIGAMMTDVNLGFKFESKETISVTGEVIKVKNHVYYKINFVDFVNCLLKSNISKKDKKELPKRTQEIYSPVPEKKITAQRVFQKINSILTSEMTIISDIGDSLFGSLDIEIHEANQFISNAYYAAMGYAVPAALGVQMAKPRIRPIVIVGDGAFQMTGTEFSSLVRFKLNPIIFVLNNRGYATERLILDGMFNDLHNWDYEKITLLTNGGVGYKVQTEEELDYAVSRSLCTQNQPSIIHVVLDAKDHSASLERMFKRKNV